MALVDCSKIAAGVAAVICDDVPVSGTAQRIILVNWGDVNLAATQYWEQLEDDSASPVDGSVTTLAPDGTVPSAMNPAVPPAPKSVCVSLALKTGAKGYEFGSVADATVGEVSLNKLTYFSNWNHQITMRLFTKNEECKRFVNSMRNARVMAIVENKALGRSVPYRYNGAGGTQIMRPNGVIGGTKYEIYGLESGLELSEAPISTVMDDSVVFQVVLASGTSKETTIAKSFFVPEITSVVPDDMSATEAAITAVLS